MKIKRLNVFKDNDAQAMVEFMLVFPMFILLVFGIIEFAFLSLVHQNVNYASFNAARAEIVGMCPYKSAWMSMYVLSPHYVQNISPLDSLKYAPSNLNFGSVDIDNRFSFYANFVIGTPCMLKMLCMKDPLFDFSAGGSFTIFGNTVTNIEDFFNAILDGLAGGASSLLNSAKQKYNDGVDEVGYAIPPFIRKLLYSMAFTEINKKTFDDDIAPRVKVTVTYYYILKFPVIQNIVYYMNKLWGTGDEKIFKGTNIKWAKAEILSDVSGLRFIPITHSCTMGDEKMLARK